MPDKCMFCQIIAGKMPANIIHRDEQVTAIRDINPQAPVHILVMLNRHLTSVAHAQPSDEALLGTLILAASQIAEKEGLAANGYRLVINTGSNGGQTAGHLHLHLLGGRRMTWPPG